MKTRIQTLLLPLLIAAGAGDLWAQGTAFYYQGRLNSSTSLANGLYDINFSLYPAAGGQIGATFSSPATPVTNGLFRVTLDFGASFPGQERWLEIAVRTNGTGAFETLIPRQKLLPTPYAITAGAVSGNVSAGQLTGTLPSTALSGAYSGALTLSSAANSFTGNGSGLTGLN